jgi:hypothetical protein
VRRAQDDQPPVKEVGPCPSRYCSTEPGQRSAAKLGIPRGTAAKGMEGLEELRLKSLVYNEWVDRLNAIRLLQALVAAGANFKTPMADPWIQKVALEIGLQDGELYSALAYAGTQDWLADSKKEGWTSLTRAGEAVAKS